MPSQHFFAISGYKKLFDPVFIESMDTAMKAIGVPHPIFVSGFLATDELIFGLLFCVGFLTRICASVLICMLFAALAAVDMHTMPSNLDFLLSWYSYFFYLPKFPYTIILFSFVQYGEGDWSIDKMSC
ncbi:DoxX family protein [Sphingobacterium paludis]|uniref:DoxX family protein n=1 Tax=Sphingobacterium paludis TaxID=1476465 RepID=UPI0014153109